MRGHAFQTWDTAHRFLTVFQGVIYARVPFRVHVDVHQHSCRAFLPRWYVNHLSYSVSRALSIRRRRNSAIHVPLIIAIFDPPLWRADRAHESGNGRNAVKPYHYAVVYKRMPALCVRFVNAPPCNAKRFVITLWFVTFPDNSLNRNFVVSQWGNVWQSVVKFNRLYRHSQRGKRGKNRGVDLAFVYLGTIIPRSWSKSIYFWK